jgi:hypothetical protein
MDDLECMACPAKYRHIATFYKYYSGQAKAPYPTLFSECWAGVCSWGQPQCFASYLWQLAYWLTLTENCFPASHPACLPARLPACSWVQP